MVFDVYKQIQKYKQLKEIIENIFTISPLIHILCIVPLYTLLYMPFSSC